MAHRKKRLVTKANGTMYRLSVRGAEVPVIVSPLSQSAVEMHVAAVDEQMLARNVSRLA